MTEVLVMTRTAGYRHESIPDACAALAGVPSLRVHLTEDSNAVEDCQAYGTVIFLSTTGSILDGGARRALRTYVEGGGGFVGIHSAAATELDWPWYGELLGARFAGHPDGVQEAMVYPMPGVPWNSPLPSPWEVIDEWYAFDAVREDVEVLLHVDEASYDPGQFSMAAPHPQAWRRRVGAGRSWYTALGHERALWSDAQFLAHVLTGISWTSRRAGADCFSEPDDRPSSTPPAG